MLSVPNPIWEFEGHLFTQIATDFQQVIALRVGSRDVSFELSIVMLTYMIPLQEMQSFSLVKL